MSSRRLWYIRWIRKTKLYFYITSKGQSKNKIKKMIPFTTPKTIKTLSNKFNIRSTNWRPQNIPETTESLKNGKTAHFHGLVSLSNAKHCNTPSIYLQTHYLSKSQPHIHMISFFYFPEIRTKLEHSQL